jgi:hypothetical protein
MTHTTPAGNSHLQEGEMMRYLDGEMPVGERSRVASHLLTCAECAAAVDALRIQRQRFADLLSDCPVPALNPARRAASLERIERSASRTRRSAGAGRSRAIGVAKAAAVGGILLAATLSTSPVRAFVSDIWSAVSVRVDRLVTTRPGVSSPESVALSNASIGFVPTEDVFRLEVRTPQRAGSLTLSLAAGASVSARAVNTTDTVDIVVLPSGLRIENRLEASANYAVTVPRNLREVRVKVGDAPELVYPIESLATSWISVIALSGPDQPAEVAP